MSNLDVALRLRLINGIKPEAAGVRGDLDAITAAAKRVGGGAGSMNVLGTASGRLGNQLNVVATAAGRADANLRRMGSERMGLARLDADAKALTTDLNRAADASKRLREQGRLASGAPRMTADAAGFGGLARTGLQAAGAIGGAFGVAQVVRSSVKSYADLETAAKALGITAGKTDAEIAGVVERFRSVGPAMGATAKEMLETTQTFVAAGLDFETAVSATPAAVKAAKASFGEIGDTAQAGVAAINNLNIKANELPEAFDRMAKAGKEGNVELKNLSRILPSVAAAGSNLGLTGLSGLTDIVSALEIIGKVTATPDQAANRLENLFGKATADETVKGFKKLGKEMGRTVELEKEMEEGAKRGESKLAVLLRLTKELTKGDPFRINEVFGDKEAREGITALLRFESEYDGIRDRIRKGSRGMIDADFKSATARLAADFERAGAVWDRLMGRMGEASAPTVSWFVREATDFAERLEKGETILQRLDGRMVGERPNFLPAPMVGNDTLDEWVEKKFPWLSGKVWNEKIDEKIGKTRAEALKRHQEANPLAPPLRMGVDPTAPIHGKPAPINDGKPGLGAKAFLDQYPLGAPERRVPLPPSRPPELPRSGAPSGINTIDDVLGPTAIRHSVDATIQEAARLKVGLAQDLSDPARESMKGYNTALQSGANEAVATATSAAAQIKSALSFTATPTIAPRLVAPSAPAVATGGVRASASPPPKIQSASLRRGGNTFTGPITIQGARDLAGIERQLQRHADRRARDSRDAALHDTGIESA